MVDLEGLNYFAAIAEIVVQECSVLDNKLDQSADIYSEVMESEELNYSPTMGTAL